MGYCPWGGKESDRTGWLTFTFFQKTAKLRGGWWLSQVGIKAQDFLQLSALRSVPYLHLLIWKIYPSFPWYPLLPRSFSSKQSCFNQDNLTGKGILHSSVALTAMEGLRHFRKTNQRTLLILPEEVLLLSLEYGVDIQQGRWKGNLSGVCRALGVGHILGNDLPQPSSPPQASVSLSLMCITFIYCDPLLANNQVGYHTWNHILKLYWWQWRWFSLGSESVAQ